MTTKQFIIPLLCLLCCLPALLTGQKEKLKKYRYLGRPEVLIQVEDYEENGALYRDNYEAIINEASTRAKTKEPWVVMADREGVEVFEDEDEERVVETLRFRQGPFYVIDEEDEHIEIATGTLSRGKVEGRTEGWVRKKDMLLWTRSITGRSKIPKFVFILHKANAVNNIFKSGKTKASLYDHPTAERAIDKIQIFQFYSVIKQEGSRYLLSSKVDLQSQPSQRTFNKNIIGWVDAVNCTEWNTRVVLEPNFATAAAAERKRKANYRVIGYGTSAQAGKHARSGVAQPNAAVWNNDPAALDASTMAKTDPGRFLGSVMRFPLLSGTAADADFYRSGVIGEVKLDGKEINVNELSQFCEVLNKKANAKNRVNVLYVVQGTYNMNPYKADIIASMAEVTQAFSGMNANIRYGGVVYRNITDENIAGGLVQIHELNRNRASLEDFIERVPFDNFESEANANSPVTTYALEQGLLKADFNQEETNIVLLIGTDPDYRYDQTLRQQYRQHPSAVPSSRLVADLSANEVELFSFCMELKSRANYDYLDFSKGLISRAAIKVYNDQLRDAPEQYRKQVEVEKQEPSFPAIPDNPARAGGVMVTRSAIPGGVNFPADQKPLTILPEMVAQAAKQSRKKVAVIQRIVDDYCVKGNSWQAINRRESEKRTDESSDSFGPVMLDILNKATKEVAIPAEYLGKRYQLYTEVYFPREIKGANAPTMSDVLFIKDNDVALYLNTVENIKNSMGGASDSRRQAIVDIYATLLRHFTGNEQLNNKELESYSINAINRIMFGLGDEGVSMEGCEVGNFNLRNILDSRKVSDDTINDIHEDFDEVIEYLKRNVLSRDFEFVYTTRSGDKYYWLPLDKMYSCGS